MTRPVRSVSRTRSSLGRTLGWSAGLALILPWVPAFFGWATDVEWLSAAGTLMVGMGLLLAPVLLSVAPLVAWIQNRSTASIQVDEGALVIRRGAGVERVGRAKIEEGVLVPSASGLEVQLYLDDGDTIRVGVEDERAGHALLDALDLGADERRVRVQLAEPRRMILLAAWRLILTTMTWFLLLGWAVQSYRAAYGAELPFIAFGLWFACIVATFWGWQRVRRPPSVIVGSDGVRIDRAIGSTLVPLPEISRAWAQGADVFLRRTDGALETISGGLAAPGRGENAASSLALGIVRRIEEARSQETAPTPAVAASLDRAGRTFAAWREALKVAVAPGADYRSASLALEDVELALADATAPAQRRLGAAIALREANAPGARERIRIAAGLTSADELRLALERAAEEELDAEALSAAADAVERTEVNARRS